MHRLLATLTLLAGLAMAGIVIPPAQATTSSSPDTAPTPADLAADATVQLTPAIRTQAEQLGRSPVALKNWVTSHIRYTPYHGAVQGSAQTLESGRGNAHDQASLLIALLRASGIPARPVQGTVEVPIARLLNALVLTPDQN